MSNEARRVAQLAQELADEIPLSVAEDLSEKILRLSADISRERVSEVLAAIPNSHHRAKATEFLRSWETAKPGVTHQAVALAVLTASQTRQSAQSDQKIELVWTGPESGLLPTRRTEQALQQVVNAASKCLLVVSYAVYKIPRVCEDLVRATERGVRVRIVIESPEDGQGEEAYSTLKALGRDVVQNCEVYRWPHDKRPTDEGGHSGILHVKCAVADGQRLFVSSANLTDYAFNLNMELGVLISGGRVPQQVERHFEELIRLGVLRRAK